MGGTEEESIDALKVNNIIDTHLENSTAITKSSELAIEIGNEILVAPMTDADEGIEHDRIVDELGGNTNHNQQIQTIPHEKQIDDATTINVSVNDDMMLDFGDFGIVTNHTQVDTIFNDSEIADNFDLLGFESPGTIFPLSSDATTNNEDLSKTTQILSNVETSGDEAIVFPDGNENDQMSKNGSADTLINIHHHDRGSVPNNLSSTTKEEKGEIDIEANERLIAEARLESKSLESDRLVEVLDNTQTAIFVQEQQTNSMDATNTLITENESALATPPLMSVAETNSQQLVGREENVDGTASLAVANEPVEERTEEEEEWLSMGLGLGDALRQIVALTDERDLALVICQEKDDRRTKVEALFDEVQSRLEAEMNRRAESDSELRRARETMKLYDEKLKAYESMKDNLEKVNTSLMTMAAEKSKVESEVGRLREMIEESEQKEAVLSNRLNEAKKKEANKASTAGRLDAENEQLKEDLEKTQSQLDEAMKAKTKLEANMEKLKAKAVERVKQAETALAEERELNEERKKKMKTFVETKAEEVKVAKERTGDMQKELDETRASLRSSRDREEVLQKELEATRVKNRELQRDMDRMKRSSEELHEAGNKVEQELEKYASETEEHKKKRMSAKHEIMQMVRTLESERAVSAKLKEAVKFTLTPKALSQQELLTECLRDFEIELERLAAKIGKDLQPSAEKNSPVRENSSSNGTDAVENHDIPMKPKKSRASKTDVDTERLLSNLENETQHVSKKIMALAGDIERMRSLLNDENSMFSCMSYFSNILTGTGEAKHQRLTDRSDSVNYEENNTGRFV